MKVQAQIERATLCTGHEVYHATLPVLDMPVPLVYGEGKTEEQAVEDLNRQLMKNSFDDIVQAV